MDDPKRTHEREQAVAAMRDLAALSLAYLRGLLEAGATPEEATIALRAYTLAITRGDGPAA